MAGNRPKARVQTGLQRRTPCPDEIIRFRCNTNDANKDLVAISGFALTLATMKDIESLASNYDIRIVLRNKTKLRQIYVTWLT